MQLIKVMKANHTLKLYVSLMRPIVSVTKSELSTKKNYRAKMHL